MKWTFKARKDVVGSTEGQAAVTLRHIVGAPVHRPNFRCLKSRSIRSQIHFTETFAEGSGCYARGRVSAELESASDRAGGESRQHFRSSRKLRWAVDLELVRSPGQPASPRLRAHTQGISLGGAFLVHDEPLPVGTALDVWLHPDDPGPDGPRVIRLRAEVRWVNETPNALPRGFGVAFRAITAADEIALHGGFSRSEKVV
jgi:hypothetical protein